MPYRIEHRPRKDGRDWAIIKTSTGEVVGTSKTKEDAEGSITARNMSDHKKRK